MSDNPGKIRSIQELSKDSFDSFLDSLSLDRAQAAEKYMLLRSKIILYFNLREYQDAEGLADEVLFRIMKRFPEKEGTQISNISFYALGVAKNLSREYMRRSRKSVTIEEVENISFEPDFYDMQEEDEREQKLYHCLQQCLNMLPVDNKEVILKYYISNRDMTKYRENMASELGVTLNALRVRLHRIKQNLHKCILKCLN